MVIGIDASRANSSKKTGVEWYAFHVIQGLKKVVNNDVHVVLYSREPLVGELAVLPKSWSSKVLSWKPRFLWTQIRLGWEMLRHSPEVLFVPAHVPPLIHPKKTVTTIHDVAARQFPESYTRFQRWYSLWSARYAVCRLWRVIVPSVFTKKEVLGMVGSKNTGHVSVIPHGYDEGFLHTPDKKIIETVCQKHAIKGHYIITLGRRETKKNTLAAVNAFETLKQDHPHNTSVAPMQLVLVGKPGFGSKEVDAMIAVSPYKEDIICIGWAPQQDVRVLMHGASMLVFPSFSEGFGMPLLEAFAAKTMVIAGSGSSLEEVGGDAAVYVEPQNVPALAQAIYMGLTEEHKRNVLIQKGSERVKKYSWNICAEETRDVLLHNC